MHPYAPTPDLMREHAEALGTLDRPLMFTEWGGYFVDDNPALLTRFIQFIKECWQNEGDKPIVAGACLWMWAEMFEFSRAEPACADGILHESLVDRYGNAKMNYEVFRREFAGIDEKPGLEYAAFPGNIIHTGDSYPIEIAVQNDDGIWQAMMEDAKTPIGKYYYKFKAVRGLEHGPIIQCDPGMICGLRTKLLLKPAAVPFGNSIVIPINRTAKSVYIFGNASLPKGWPISGEYGEDVGGYTIKYADGTVQKQALRNGKDITTITGVFGPSRIDPVAANAPRAYSFAYDFDKEQYHINLLKIDTVSDAPVSEIRVWTTGEGYCLLLYGITLA